MSVSWDKPNPIKYNMVFGDKSDGVRIEMRWTTRGYAGLDRFPPSPTIMGLARRQRNSLQDDLTTYQDIVKRSKELEKDIPPRFSPATRRKAVGKKRGPQKLKRAVKRAVPREVKAEQEAGNGVLEKKTHVAVLRPAYMKLARGPLDPLVLALAPVLKDSASFLREKAITFESHVSTNNSYDDMVRMARGLCASGDVDLGLSLRLLPKQVEVERKRYMISNSEADRLLEAVETRNAFISADLDDLFRKWSDLPICLDHNMRSVPLI